MPSKMSSCLTSLLVIFAGTSLISGSPKDWMDPEVDPCNNFYQFVCGNMIRAPPDPSDLPPFAAAQEEVQQILIQNLKTDDHDATDSIDFIRDTKNLFRSCMRTNITQDKILSSTSSENFKSYMLSHIKAIGGWPVLEESSWNETQFDWARTIVQLNNDSYWLNTFFSFEPTQSRNKTIFFGEPNLGLHKLRFLKGLKNLAVSRYLEKGIQWAVGLGANSTAARKEYTQVVDFEIKLAQLLTRNSSDETTIKDVTLGQLIGDYPFYPWREYITYSFPGRTPISLDQKVSFENYYHLIGDMYELINKTDRRILANYVAWKEIRLVVKTLKDLERTLSEIPELSATNPRETKCLQFVDVQMPYALASLYVRKRFEREDWKSREEEAKLIAEDVRRQLVAILTRATWMSGETRDKTVELVNATTIDFGYSDELYNATIIDNYYKGLRTKKTNFIESLINVNKIFRLRIAFREFERATINASERWMESSFARPKVETHYDSKGGGFITTSIGMLGSDRFLNRYRSRFMDYGRFAYEIGKRFAQILDTQRQHGRSWWTEFNQANPNYTTKCFWNRYQKFVDTRNITLAGESPALEGFITRSFGLSAAYQAYKRSDTSEEEPSIILHRKTFYPDQMFWMSAAGTFCDRVAPLRQTLMEFAANKNDSYASYELTIISLFSVMKSFSEDFDCPTNSPMNSPPNCVIS